MARYDFLGFAVPLPHHIEAAHRISIVGYSSRKTIFAVDEHRSAHQGGARSESSGHVLTETEASNPKRLLDVAIRQKGNDNRYCRQDQRFGYSRLATIYIDAKKYPHRPVPEIETVRNQTEGGEHPQQARRAGFISTRPDNQRRAKARQECAKPWK